MKLEIWDAEKELRKGVAITKDSNQILTRKPIHDFDGHTMMFLAVRNEDQRLSLCLMEGERLLWLRKMSFPSVSNSVSNVVLELYAFKEGFQMRDRFLERMRNETMFMKSLGFQPIGYDKYQCQGLWIESNFMSYYYVDMNRRSWNLINSNDGTCANTMYDETLEDELLNGPFGVVIKYSKQYYMHLPSCVRDWLVVHGY